MQHYVKYSALLLLFFISLTVFFHNCVSIHPALVPIAATGMFIGISISIKDYKTWLFYTSIVLATAGITGIRALTIAITTLGFIGGILYVLKRSVFRSIDSGHSKILVSFSKQKGIDRVLELATSFGIKNISYQVGAQYPFTLELNYIATPLTNHVFIRSIIALKSVTRVNRVSESSRDQ